MKYSFLIVLSLFFYAHLIGQENSALLCSDGIDNDGDGDMDCDDSECIAFSSSACTICGEGISFADILIEYSSGCSNRSDPFPEGAIGLADYQGSGSTEMPRVYLGDGGFIRLGFTNNLITNSGDDRDDVYIFETGFLVEPMRIGLQPFNGFTRDQLTINGFSDPDNDGYYIIATINGGVSSFDIDDALPGYVNSELKFNAIVIFDIGNIGCNGSTPGADIDAVCALSTIEIDCFGVINGPSILDSCGVCLERTDPNINMSCLDCAGVVNGVAVIDSCGECYLISDPMFNSSCSDCAEIPNGLSLIDSCGVCLLLDNLLFNQSCRTFNVFIPDAFTPNGDGVNDFFRIYSSEGVRQIKQFQIYNRWGDLIFNKTDFNITTDEWWDGIVDGQKQNSQVFLYSLEVEFITGKIESFSGDVTLLR